MTGVDYEDFILCARYNELTEIKGYFERYPDINIKATDASGNTCLHMASANGHKGKKERGK
jgi:ankyrin repeat protein